MLRLTFSKLWSTVKSACKWEEREPKTYRWHLWDLGQETDAQRDPGPSLWCGMKKPMQSYEWNDWGDRLVGRVVAIRAWGSEFKPQNPQMTGERYGIVANTCNSSPGKAEVGQSLGSLHRKFPSSRPMRSHISNNNKKSDGAWSTTPA